MLLKQSDGRLRWPEGSLLRTIERAGAQRLPLHPEHAAAAGALGALHDDPIGRMLNGSARVERMGLLTRDAATVERAAPLPGDLLMKA